MNLSLAIGEYACRRFEADTMSRVLESSVQSMRNLCELAISANSGDWGQFWTIWASSVRSFSLPPPLSHTVRQVIDWLDSERRRTFPVRLDEDWWPKGTYRSLSTNGIGVVACVSPDDGRRFLKVLAREMNLAEREEMARAYLLDNEQGRVAIDKAVAYLEEALSAIVPRDNDRLLMISY